MRWTRSDTEMLKPVAGATVGGIVVAVVAMLAPVGPIENLTSASGLSEMVPAMGPPLGDTARSLMAFGAGSAVFFALILLLIEWPREPVTAMAPVGQAAPAKTLFSDQADLAIARSAAPWLEDGTQDAEPPRARLAVFMSTISGRLSVIARNGLFHRSDVEGLRDFSDLNRGKGGDGYRNILNARDLGEPLPPLVDPDPAPYEAEEEARPDLVVALAAMGQIEPDRDDMSELGLATLSVEETSLAQDTGTNSEEALAQPHATMPDRDPAIPNIAGRDRSIENLMARLERGLRQRLVAPAEGDSRPAVSMESLTHDDMAAEPRIGRGIDEPSGAGDFHVQLPSQAPLRAITGADPASQSVADQPMDEALRAALKTLRRMTAQAR